MSVASELAPARAGAVGRADDGCQDRKEADFAFFLLRDSAFQAVKDCMSSETDKCDADIGYMRVIEKYGLDELNKALVDCRRSTECTEAIEDTKSELAKVSEIVENMQSDCASTGEKKCAEDAIVLIEEVANLKNSSRTAVDTCMFNEQEPLAEDMSVASE